MRFESKHSYFKHCVSVRTLAHKHQLLQAYLHSGSFFPPIMQVKKSSDFHVSELYCETVRNAVMANFVEPDSVCTEITFRGTFIESTFSCVSVE